MLTHIMMGGTALLANCFQLAFPNILLSLTLNRMSQKVLYSFHSGNKQWQQSLSGLLKLSLSKRLRSANAIFPDKVLDKKQLP